MLKEFKRMPVLIRPIHTGGMTAWMGLITATSLCRSPPTDVAENDMLYPVGDDAGVAESYFPYDNKGLGDELMINAAGDHPQQSSGHQPGEKAPSSRGVHGSSL